MTPPILGENVEKASSPDGKAWRGRNVVQNATGNLGHCNLGTQPLKMSNDPPINCEEETSRRPDPSQRGRVPSQIAMLSPREK